MWTLQRSDGGWEWLKCGWPPLEHDNYYGAIVAALGAGHAPGDYARSAPAQRGLERLRAYFRKTPPPDMHHQTMLHWAATRLDGLMDSDQKAATVRSLRALQRADGGWCLPSLGQWKRRNGQPNDPKSPSDGYATGLVVFVLRLGSRLMTRQSSVESSGSSPTSVPRAAASPGHSMTTRTTTSPTPEHALP